MVDGQPVQLHECNLRDLSYRPGPPPQLTLRFDYDPEWTPRELEATPTIEMRFLDVRIELWEEDRDAYDDVRAHPEWAGEVKVFDVGPDRAASRPTCRAEARGLPSRPRLAPPRCRRQ